MYVGCPVVLGIRLSSRSGKLSRLGGNRTGGAQVKGITNVTADLSAAHYAALGAHLDVLLVDLASVLAPQDFRRSFAGDAGKQVVVTSAPVYWYYEAAAKP